MLRTIRVVPVAFLVLAPLGASAQEVESAPYVVLGGVPFSLALKGGTEGSEWYEVRTAQGALLAAGAVDAYGSVTLTGLSVDSRAELPLAVQVGDDVHVVSPTLTPGWFSILPPVLAIVLALVFREVVTALFAGVWLGALAVAGFNPLSGTWRLIDQYVVPTIADTDNGHTQILVFSLLLGGMVGVIARNGGTLGIVEALAPFARSARRGKIATWLAGMAIFFDDYANTLIVGNTMRPITDRLRISREKLAYLVDSTAAPVAALVPVSTWVGYEISLIGDGMRIAAESQAADPTLAASLLAVSPFAVFIQTVPYLFYPLLALFLVFLTSAMDRDFGPMAEAELRSARGDGLHREGAQLATDVSSPSLDTKEGLPHRWWNAALPVLAVIVVVLGGLYATGRANAGPDASLMDVAGAADPFVMLLWGSLSGCLVAFLLSVGQRLLTVTEAIDAWLSGMRAMMIAMVILALAWSLGLVTKDLGTAAYLSQVLSDRVALGLIPAIVFATSAAMAFATGTSWGTMAILIPLVIPLTVSLGAAADFPTAGGGPVLLGSIASVLAGSIFGDHCSPISDTTVLSSTASACDHVDHVRTQLPYALLVALLGMAVGNIGTAYGLPPWVALLASGAALVVYLRLFGRNVAKEAASAP